MRSPVRPSLIPLGFALLIPQAAAAQSGEIPIATLRVVESEVRELRFSIAAVSTGRFAVTESRDGTLTRRAESDSCPAIATLVDQLAEVTPERIVIAGVHPVPQGVQPPVDKDGPEYQLRVSSVDDDGYSVRMELMSGRGELADWAAAAETELEPCWVVIEP